MKELYFFSICDSFLILVPTYEEDPDIFFTVYASKMTFLFFLTQVISTPLELVRFFKKNGVKPNFVLSFSKNFKATYLESTFLIEPAFVGSGIIEHQTYDIAC